MSSLPIIVIGAGGHAKVLIDAIMLQGRRIIGIVDQDNLMQGKHILGVPIIGNDEFAFQYNAENIRFVNGLGSVKTTICRKNIYDQFKSKGHYFETVVHPSATIARDVILQEGVQIMAGVVVQTGSHIGVNTIINTKASIDHDCRIGDHVHIAPGVTISGGVVIEQGVHVGAGATVIQGAKIEKDSIIGAGTVIIRDVPEKALVVGVPGEEVVR